MARGGAEEARLDQARYRRRSAEFFVKNGHATSRPYALAFCIHQRYRCVLWRWHAVVDSPNSDFPEKLAGLVRLKNFAVLRGYAIPDSTIDEIANLESAVRGLQPKDLKPEDLIKLDRLIRDVSQITYPINSENLSRITSGNGITKFSYQLLFYGLCAAVLAGFLIAAISGGTILAQWAKAPLAICLGVIGAVVYVMLPNGRLNIVAGLDDESIATNLLRVITGGLLGFVIYVVKPDFLSLQQGSEAYGLLAPLIGGYSITLVVGILAKAVTAIELTLNLDDKKTQASLRK
jgi:hypothetical protein